MYSNQRTKAARTALEGLWKRAGLKGWCWGPKGVQNCFSGTNLVLELKGELVTVSVQGDLVVISEFRRTEERTDLGKEARKALLRSGLLSEKEQEAFSMSEGNYTWLCHGCGTRGQVDPTGIDDPAVLANKLYAAHREEAKKRGRECPDKNVQIFDPQMVECKGLQGLVALQKVG